MAIDIFCQLLPCLLTTLIIEVEMNSGINPALASLSSGGTEAGETSEHTLKRNCVSSRRKCDIIGSKETTQQRRRAAAEGTMAADVTWERWSIDEWFPVAFLLGLGVAVSIGGANGRNRSPKIVFKFHVPRDDGGICHVMFNKANKRAFSAEVSSQYEETL